MIDISLLRVLKTREAFDKVYANIPIKSLEKRTQVIVADIARYYSKFTDSNEVDYVTFKDMFFGYWHKGLDTESIEFYNKILDRADKCHDDVSQRIILDALLELSLADNVMHLVEDYNRGDEIDLVSQLTTLVEATQEARDRKIILDDTPFELDVLFSPTALEEGLHYRNNELARALNPAQFGDDFTVVAARPNQGKTTFILNEITYMAHQLDDRPVLWLNNEGRRERIIKRAIQVALGAPMSKLVKMQEQGILLDEYEKAIQAPHDRIQVKDVHDAWTWQIEEIIDSVQPKIVVFDMIDHIQFAGLSAQARTDQVLEEEYKWARTLGVKYKLLPWATSQVSAEGEGEPYPDKSMLKDSKTGKQGAADNIFMIGHSNDPEKIRSRYISAPKTKSNKEGELDPRAELIFNIDTGRFQ